MSNSRKNKDFSQPLLTSIPELELTEYERKTPQATAQFTMESLPYLPPQVDLDDIDEAGLYFKPEQLQAAQKYASGKQQCRVKKSVTSKNEILFPAFIKLNTDDIIGIYKGESAAKRFTEDADKKLEEKIKKENPECTAEFLENKKIALQIFDKRYILGKGTFGSVKLAQKQDPASPEWYGLKSLEVPDNEIQYDPEDEIVIDPEKCLEYKLLSKFHQGVGIVVHTPKLKAEESKRGNHIEEKNLPPHYNILMKLARGQHLRRHLNNTSFQNKIQSSTAFAMEIALGMIKQVKAIHDKRIIHRDIKNQNFVFDPVTKEVRLIDFGFAIELKSAEEIIRPKGSGTLGYMSPECSFNKEGKRTFSLKSDIYALGVSLAELFGLARTTDTLSPDNEIIDTEIQVADEKSENYQSKSYIPNEIVRKKIADFLRKMLQDDRNLRPTIDETLDFFENLYKKILKLSYPKTGLLDLNEFMEAKDKNRFVSLFQSMDEIYLIDTTKKGYDKKTYYQISRNFEKLNCQLGNRVFYAPEEKIEKVLQAIPDKVTDLEPQVMRSYFYMTEKKEELSFLREKNIFVIQPDSEKSTSLFKSEMNSLLESAAIRPSHKKNMINHLREEIRRIDKKYQHGSAIVNRRRVFLQNAISQFQYANLSYREGIAILEKVEANMDTTRNCFAKVFCCFFAEKVTGKEKIARARKALLEDFVQSYSGEGALKI